MVWRIVADGLNYMAKGGGLTVTRNNTSPRDQHRYRHYKCLQQIGILQCKCTLMVMAQYA